MITLFLLSTTLALNSNTLFDNLTPNTSLPITLTPISTPLGAPAPVNRVDYGVFREMKGALSKDAFIESIKKQLWTEENEERVSNEQAIITREKFDQSFDYSKFLTSLQETKLTWISKYENTRWVIFKPKNNNTWPTRALEIIEYPNPDRYIVDLIVHCFESVEECTTFSDSDLASQAPTPNMNSSKNYAQWKARIQSESCKIYPPNMPVPVYPDSAKSLGIIGTVQITIVFNKCGNTRDLWINKSSRNRDLDRAAMQAAYIWQFDVDKLNQATKDQGIVTVPFTFTN